MVRFVGGLGFFIIAVCLVFGLIPVNIWSILALLLCLALGLKG